MPNCPKAPRGSDWQTIYEQDNIPVRLVWRKRPEPPHKLVTLLHGYQKCAWCGEFFAGQPATSGGAA